MHQKDVWKKYITAQSKILEHKSKSIGIDTTKPVQVNGLKLHLSIDQEVFKQVFKKEVENIFKIENFDFAGGYIQVGLDDNITPFSLSKLKALAEICYIDFNENPFIEGLITGKENNSKEELKNVIGELPTDSGLIYLTLDEWKKANQIQGLKFSKKAGAVFQIKPSISFLISTFYYIIFL